MRSDINLEHHINKIKIFNIEKFATHDGEGIRTVVFMQGCPLHCPWCSNPESQCMDSHLFYTKKKCVHCHRCVQVCPTHAITFCEEHFSYDKEKCIHCKQCVSNCFNEAIEFSGILKTVEEIVAEVEKDKDYYDYTGGGVTISGGEPFLQFDGFLELLKALKKESLNIAVETTGQCTLTHLKQAIPYIDTFLFDVKHTDKEVLKSVTGGDLDMILNNLRYIAENYKERVIIRVPVIPKFNYEKDVLASIIKLGSELRVKEVHLLPYHTLGKNKYEKMQKPYRMEGIPTVNKSELLSYIDIGKVHNVTVKIGG
ncbi:MULTISPECIES: glycyl-radical enzyme activating protein [Tissierellales]|jgi:pyruvate formate lyase activating enzyme|uniref:Glycyl-radical enzyme activating protein n=1 Tax=Acidilutibacter cellobiosedens TaxID=2507161 RepID=A0A410QFI1_9FIRM|nr:MULTISPECIES: glycyl-radical enzyme activating protein [Tissierellales]QAT62833.1 glycyl-radical enzyme activating protein [Acidilutibacter cellobiosedens]SCL93117.1 4-hydroxyphenylacetate decarboxylase activating enzyme [Sporanaerobacter sp. PP17-6a]